MATLREESALRALNEQDYVNKLYDGNTNTTKELLQQNYSDNTGLLDSEKESVQRQTNENVNRTNVEAVKMQGTSNQNMSSGAAAQAGLVRDNAQRGNVTSLRQKQNEADMEIERQRQLLASQFSTAIQQAQAENDMEKAQQLYNAAKKEEEKLLALRRSGGTILAEKGDTTVQDALLNGEMPAADFSGDTWEQVLRNEQAINSIYDNELQSKLLSLRMENEEQISDLEAQQRQKQAQTDQALTQSYVDALRKARNYQEVQTAYGQGSGTAAAAQLARDTELQRNLTDLRGVQMGTDAGIGMERFDIFKTYRDKMDQQTRDTNRRRAEALFDAAEDEENKLYETQLQIGQQLAKEGDYSVLGKLYGWTQDQIDRVQGTGKYAPVYYEEPARRYRKPETQNKGVSSGGGYLSKNFTKNLNMVK